MKPMTIEQAREARTFGGTKPGSITMAAYASQIVHEFIVAGFDAAEIEPEDYGRTRETMAKSTAGSMRSALTKSIEQMALETVVEAFRSKDRVFLMRVDPKHAQ